MTQEINLPSDAPESRRLATMTVEAWLLYDAVMQLGAALGNMVQWSELHPDTDIREDLAGMEQALQTLRRLRGKK
jgi:hypothetical protein